MNKYRSAMEKIVVTPQMEERILRNISRKKETGIETKKKINLRWAGYVGIAAACCAVILCVMIVYPSFVNLNQRDKLVKNPQKEIIAQSEGNSAETVLDSVKQQEKALESVGNSAETTVQPEKRQEQAQKSVSGPPKKVGQPKQQQEQAPKPAGNLAGTTAQPVKQKGQSPASDSNSGEPATPIGGQQVLGGNPIVEANGVDELKKAVAFELLIPGKLPAGYKIDSTSVISKEMAQINYSNGNNKITYRVSKGSEDVSGDYTSYDKSEVIKVNEIEVSLKGNNSLINLATWIKGGCSYSLSFSPGIDKITVVSIIEGMKKA